MRYLLTPVYYVSGILNLSTFGKKKKKKNCIYCIKLQLFCLNFFVAQHTSFLVSLGYLFALVLTLVPSPLLEFRYFIIPFLFFMVHIPPPLQVSRTLLGLGLYLVIHIITIYLFLYKPFSWPNEPNAVQRFMW